MPRRREPKPPPPRRGLVDLSKYELYSHVNELEELRRENSELRRQTLALTAQIAELITELARLNERVSELLAVAQRERGIQRALRPEEPDSARDSIGSQRAGSSHSDHATNGSAIPSRTRYSPSPFSMWSAYRVPSASERGFGRMNVSACGVP